MFMPKDRQVLTRIYFSSIYVLSGEDKEDCKKFLGLTEKEDLFVPEKPSIFLGLTGAIRLKDLFEIEEESSGSLSGYYRSLRLDGLPESEINENLLIVIIPNLKARDLEKKFLELFKVIDTNTLFPVYSGGRLIKIIHSKREWLKLPDENKYYPGRLEEVPKGYTPEYYIYHVGL